MPVVLTTSQEENAQGPLMTGLILIAGITNDVCTIFPTLTLLAEGYRVAVVADAGGSITKVGDEIAIRRMERAGADITAVNQILAQLARNWVLPSEAAVLPSIFDLLPARPSGR